MASISGTDNSFDLAKPDVLNKKPASYDVSGTYKSSNLQNSIANNITASNLLGAHNSFSFSEANALPQNNDNSIKVNIPQQSNNIIGSNVPTQVNFNVNGIDGCVTYFNNNGEFSLSTTKGVCKSPVLQVTTVVMPIFGQLSSVEQPLPAAEQRLPVVEQPLPAAEQTLPVVEQPLPAAKQEVKTEGYMVYRYEDNNDWSHIKSIYCYIGDNKKILNCIDYDDDDKKSILTPDQLLVPHESVFCSIDDSKCGQEICNMSNTFHNSIECRRLSNFTSNVYEYKSKKERVERFSQDMNGKCKPRY
jgi:hypothetical protein